MTRTQSRISLPMLVVLGGVLIYEAAIVSGIGSDVLRHGGFLVLLLVGTASVVAKALRPGPDRPAWALFAAALVVWMSGSAWSAAVGPTDRAESVAQLLWLAMYPLAFAGLVLLILARLRRPPAALLVDGLMVTLVVSAVATAFALPALSENASGLDVVTHVLNLGYVIGASVLVAGGLTGAVILGRDAGRPAALIGAGAVALAIADVVWTIRVARGPLEPGAAIFALFPLWPLLVAAAARVPVEDQRPVTASEGGVRVSLAVIVASLAAVALLVANEWVDVPAASVVLAGLGCVAAIHRTLLLLARGLRVAREASRRRSVVEDVRHALACDELEVHFQPLVDVRTGGVRGAEALLRWRRDGALVGPDRFLPEVECDPLMRDITDFVLDRALAGLAAWRAAGHDMGVSVNLAAANLVEDDLEHRVRGALERYGLDAGRLTLEMTETATVADSAAAQRVLSGLAGLGVDLAVDDFGTGHSSLIRLARFPMSELKIDRTFVMELDAAERPIVATSIQLAHTLGLRVVAEGVETVAMLNALRGMGCDIAQGFLFSRPLSAERFALWLDDRRLERSSETAGQSVQDLLAELVSDLGVDAAFVAEFIGEREAIRTFEGPGTFGPIRQGAEFDRADGYCDRVVRGVFPNVLPRVREDERTRDMPVTAEANVGAYLSVPLHDGDGRLFGTLCGVSHGARPELGERDVQLLHAAAERLRPLLDAAALAIAARPAGD